MIVKITPKFEIKNVKKIKFREKRSNSIQICNKQNKIKRTKSQNSNQFHCNKKLIDYDAHVQLNAERTHIYRSMLKFGGGEWRGMDVNVPVISLPNERVFHDYSTILPHTDSDYYSHSSRSYALSLSLSLSWTLCATKKIN